MLLPHILKVSLRSNDEKCVTWKGSLGLNRNSTMSHTTTFNTKLLSTFLLSAASMVLLWHSHGPLSSIYVHVGCVENCILPMCVSDASKQCRAIIMSKLGSPGWRRSWCWLSLSWVYHHFKHTFQLWAVSMQIASVTLMISNFLKIFRIMPNFMMSAQSRPVGHLFLLEWQLGPPKDWIQSKKQFINLEFVNRIIFDNYIQ